MAGLFVMVVFWGIHWAIILPVALIVASPYILLASIFRSPPYRSAVCGCYRRIFVSFARFWNEGGWGFTP